MRLARPLASALVFWLSGVACLLVCASMCARTVTAAERQPERHACCARSAEIEAEQACQTAAPGAQMRAEPSFEDCCILTARASARAPLPEGFSIPLAPAVARVAPEAAVAGPLVGSVPAESAPVLNRGDTHLRCCVFLI